MEFKFVQENETFTWQNNSYKLTFSKPSIQPWNDEHRKIYSANDILYYYYNLDTYKLNDGKWEHISGIMAYDFPAIFRLLDLVDYMLATEPDADNVSDNPNSSGEFKMEYDTNYWLREDYYSIKAFADVCGELHYEVYAGTEYQGIRVTVNEWELYELKKCAEAFVQFSIEHANALSNKSNIAHCNSHRSVDGRLYEYYLDYWSNPDEIIIDHSRIEGIFMAGDKLSITVLMHDGGHYYSIDYEKKQIADITDKEIILTDGSRLPAHSIIHTFRDVSDEEHHYNAEQITDSFISRLSRAEKEDFSKLTEEQLFHKYHGAIIDSADMYLEEHNFPVLIESDDHRDNVHETVMQIIRKIKSTLT